MPLIQNRKEIRRSKGTVKAIENGLGRYGKESSGIIQLMKRTTKNI